MELATLQVQPIPISKIRPNAKNPRHFIQPQAVETLAASMGVVGQETPIKVRKVSSQLTIDSSQENSNQQPEIPTPQNDPIGSGTRNDNDGYEYELIGGHIRLEAAKNLGWVTINAMVLEVTDDQAKLAAILDNQGEDMHWLDWDLAIEDWFKTHPGITQQLVGDQFGVTQAKISYARKVAGVLTDSSKELIYNAVIKSGSNFELTERPVLAIADLENPQKVEEALKVVIDQRLTEAQAKDLVDWIRTGNDPAGFCMTLGKLPGGGKVPGREAIKGLQSFKDNHMDQNTSYWQALPEWVKVKLTKSSYKIQMEVPINLGAAAVYGALVNMEHIKALAGEAENTQYKDALQKICVDGAAEWVLEKDKAKLKSAKVEKGKNQLTVDSSQLAGKEIIKNKQPEILTSQNEPIGSAPQDDGKTEQPGEVELSKTGFTSSPQVGAPPQDDNKEAAEPVNTGGGLLGQLHGAVKGYLQNLPGTLTDSLVKDGKQAVNYEIRKGMRNILKDVF